MKEKELIKIIKTTLNSKYIGDDCAYLKDLGITISQDSLVENIHFDLKFITPYQLGYKSAMVNISDICASGAEPVYMTISLSLPNYVDENFVKNFYDGAKDACQNIEIVGGDLTGSDKIFISITAIGKTENRKISSRSNAKDGHKVIISGEHGNSAYGLKLLLNNEKQTKENEIFITSHLMPVAQRDFSKQIAENIKSNYAMMDSSDGLADALIQIAKSSNVLISIDTSKIPHNPKVSMNEVLFGGEDYQLVATVPEEFLEKISNYTIIGEVKPSKMSGLEIDGKFFDNIDNKLFNHFGEKNEN